MPHFKDALRYPGLLKWGWWLFFAGAPFSGANSLGVLVLLAHWWLDRRAIGQAMMSAGRLQRRIWATLAVFFTVCLAAAAFSGYFALSLASLLGMALAISFGLVYVSSIGFLPNIDREWYLKLMWPLPVAATAHALWAMAAFAQTKDRAVTVLGPNGVGTVMVVSLGLGLAWGSLQLGRRLWWLVPYAVILTGGVLASVSRGAWVGLVALLIFVGCRAFKTHAMRWVLIGSLCLAVLCIASLLFQPFLAERFVSIFSLATNEGRLAIYQGAWAMFLDHPWLGVGPGIFGEHWDAYMPPTGGPGVTHVHNLALQVLVQTGIGGAVLFLGILLALLLSGFRLWREKNWPMWFVFATFMAWLVRDQVDATLINVNNAFLFWSMGGAVLGFVSGRYEASRAPAAAFSRAPMRSRWYLKLSGFRGH